MDTYQIILLLILAALLEAGGDYIVGYGMGLKYWLYRYLIIASGGVVLLVYGYTVNSAPWDFSGLLGTYVVIFFICTQVIGFLSTKKPTAGIDFFYTWQLPSGLKFTGSLLIIIGGFIFAIGQYLTPTSLQGK